MSRDDVREALLLLAEPAEASPEFRRDLLQRFLAEATATEAPTAPAEPPSRARHIGWLKLRPIPAVAAGLVIALVGALLVIFPRTPSAWAALERAREQFRTRPLHATISNDTQAFGPDLETIREIRVVEVWFESETRWREKTVSYNLFPKEAGNFVVTDGEQFGTFSSEENTFNVQPASEIDDLYQMSGLTMHDPTQHSWGTSTGIKPTQQFLDENCEVSEDRLAGRRADRLSCETGLESDHLREATIWLDRETGLILKLETLACGTVEGEQRCGQEAIRQVTSIEFNPTFPDGIFDVTPPEGATVRGESFAPDPERSATFEVDVDPDRIQATLGALWVAGATGGRGPEAHGKATLLRIDRGGHVVATIDNVTTFAAGEEAVWVVIASEGPASLRRLDPRTNRFVGTPLSLTDFDPQDIHDIAAGEGAVWIVGAKGEGEQRRGWLLRIDPETTDIRRIELEGMPGKEIAPGFAPSNLAVGGGAVWVNVSFQPANMNLEPINQIQKIDAATGRNQGKINPSGRVVSGYGEGALWTLRGAGSSATLTKYDPATLNEIAKVDLPPARSAMFSTSYGVVWVMSPEAGTLTRVDALGMRVLGDPIQYAPEGGQAFVITDGNRTAWVGMWAGVGRGVLVQVDVRRS